MWKMLKEATSEFCSNTGLHGYCFLKMPKRNFFDRIIWLIILITSVLTAFVISLFAWKSTQRNLVKTVADSTHNPIWNYPFPAVTVCNFNQISKSKVYEMVKHMNRPSGISTEELIGDFRHLFKLIHNDGSDLPKWNYIRFQNVLDQNNITADRMLQYVAPNCTEMLQRCKWKGEGKRCDILFEHIKTSLGFCCSFNYYAIKNHLFSGAMPHKFPTKPRKVSGCGYKTALDVLVENNPDDYFASDVISHGCRILIHNPYDFPDWSTSTLLLEINSSAFINVSPIISKCSHGAAKLSIKDRNCLFTTEKQLDIFQHYTHHNCMLECRMNLTASLCGCMPFYLHNKNGTFRENRICNLRDYECLVKHNNMIRSSIPGVTSKLQKENRFDSCKCLPDCEYCSYPFECSQGEFSRKYATNDLSLFNGVKLKNHSLFRVFFDDLVATRRSKVLLFNWHTLFALFGGLLSLFTGFSFGTAFEVVHFFIIRPSIRILEDRSKRNTKGKKKNKARKERIIKSNALGENFSRTLVQPKKINKNRHLPFVQ